MMGGRMAALAVVTGLLAAGSAAAQPVEGKAVAWADAEKAAKAALDRAGSLRAGGDETHALAADGLANEWTQTARDLRAAVEAEQAAAEVRKKAVDAEQQLERSRALVEAALASVGRLQAELAQAEGKPAEPRTAVEVHDGEKPPARKKPAPKKPDVPGAP